MTKSRKVAYSGVFGHPAENGQEGRLGPPEFTGKAGKAGKAGKELFPRFLRVTRAVGQGYPGSHLEAIVTYLSRLQRSWRRPSRLLRDPTPVGSLQSSQG